MNKFTLNVSTVIGLTIFIYMAYYLLLSDNYLHSSIDSIVSYSSHVTYKKRHLIVGILPIYIATIIFGAAILGIYLGSVFKFMNIRCTIKSK